MKFSGFIVTFDRGGGLCAHSYVKCLLEDRLGDFGSAITEIEIYPRLAMPDHVVDEVSRERFEEWQKSFEKLPLITFRRGLRRVEIAFRSKHFVAKDMDNWQISTDRISLASDEVLEALQLLKKRVKSTDDFDVNRFLSDAKAVLSDPPDSLDEWNALRGKVNRQRIEKYDNLGPWEKLDIDWRHFHPQARQLLDEPFYWECMNELAPHGNDSGAELLEHYRQWDRRNAETTPLAFLEALNERCGVDLMAWSLIDTTDIVDRAKEEQIKVEVGNEAAIALAFAVLKLRAKCPVEVVELANLGLDRTWMLVNASSLDEAVKAEWDATIQKMRQKLFSSPR